jgi:hypothetical protein
VHTAKYLYKNGKFVARSLPFWFKTDMFAGLGAWLSSELLHLVLLVVAECTGKVRHAFEPIKEEEMDVFQLVR